MHASTIFQSHYLHFCILCSLERNPLIVPLSLDYRVATPRDPSRPRPAWEVSDSSFHAIGGNSMTLSSNEGPPTNVVRTSSNGTVPSPFASSTTPKRKMSQNASNVKRIKMLRMLPSQVGDVDMLRIREVEKVVRNVLEL